MPLKACPRCGARKLAVGKNKTECKAQGCDYQELPVSYKDEEQGKKTKKRFSTIENVELDYDGMNTKNEQNQKRQIAKGLKIIRNTCLILKLSKRIESAAESRFKTIRRLSVKSEEFEDRNFAKFNKKIAFYSIYSACIENEDYSEAVYLANLLKVSNIKWNSIITHFNNELKNKIDFIPNQQPQHHIYRVCKARQIHPNEQQAMIKMCENIRQHSSKDGWKSKTLAACVFWKICEYSLRYTNSFKMSGIYRNKNELQEMTPSQQLKYIHVARSSIQQYWDYNLSQNFYERFLPEWEGRINI